MNDLIEEGYWVERFHASKGTFDVIAVNENHTRLIQVKRSKTIKKKIQSIANAYRKDLEVMMKMPYNPGLLIELWVWFDTQYRTFEKGQKKRTFRMKAHWRKFDVSASGITEVAGWVI